MPLKSLAILALKIAVTGGLLWYLSTIIDFKQAWKLIKHGNINYLILTILAMFATNTIMAWRWQAVSRALGLKESYRFFFKGTFTGLWFNQILPGGIGGDGVKMMIMRRHFGKGSGAVSSVLFERAAGFVVMMFFVFIGLPISFELMVKSPAIPTVYAIISACGLVGFGLFLLLHKWAWVQNIKLVGWLINLSQNATQVFVINRNSRNIAFFSSLLIQLSGILHFYLCAKVLGLEIEFLNMFALIPPIFLLLIIPISLAGWGIREGAVVGLFTMANLATGTEAATMSILYGLLIVLTSLPGCLTLFVKGKIRHFQPS